MFKRVNIFYLIFITTILFVRTGVFLFPQKKVVIDGMIIHHFWIGVVLILLALVLFKRWSGLRISIFSIGLGLVADELVYIVLGAGPVNKYWSIYSVLGAGTMVIVIFLTRERLVNKFFKN